MRQLLANSWWILALRGALALLFGILALLWPGVTLIFLVALFAAYAIVSGAVALAGALRNRRDRGWWLALVLGLVSLAAGILAIFYPGITALVLVIMMGVNAVLSGVLEIAMAVRLRREIEGKGEWLLGLAGLVSILFGAFVLAFPGPGALALVWLVALHAMTIGILFLIAAFRLRASARTSAGIPPPRGAHPA
jgi:uncharacterized membrane protein HdeD (DUF308 family)